MTETTINGKAVKLVMNMRGLREFGAAIGAETPTEAGQKIASISTSKKGVTFESMDIFSNLIFVMAKRGGSYTSTESPRNYSSEEKKKVLFLDDCYEAINDVDSINAMLKELELFLPNQEIVKKKEAEKVTA